jgi:signal transduction histidine kinase
MNFLSQKRSKILIKEEQPHISNSLASTNFYYKEIASLTASGGWSIDFVKKTTLLDPQTRKILNIPKGFKASPKKLMLFYPEGKNRQKATQLFLQCSNGVSFNSKVKMVTYSGALIWVHAAGKPILNTNGEIIGIRGVFRDIDKEFNKNKDLKHSLKTIASQNARLLNFANLVTHNIRSQGSNLQLTLELLKSAENKSEEKELLTNLEHISTSLNTTIKSLNEIADIQSKSTQPLERLTFKDYLLKAKRKLNNDLSEIEIEIFSEFSEVPKVNFNPEFLENIFTGILSYFIKNRPKNKVLVIDVYTYKENGKKHLVFKDTGDILEITESAEDLFEVYNHPENIEHSNKLNLFILKNQIESLQAKIEVSSGRQTNTLFTIQF